MEITFFHEHIKNNLHVEHSHWKLIGNWQKDPCTTKAMRRIHKWLGRKERKVIQSGPVLLGGDSEEKGGYMDGHPPGEWGVTVPGWVPESWGPMWGRWAPLAGKGPLGLTVGRLYSTHEELTSPGGGVEKGLFWGCWVSWQPQLRRVSQPTLNEHSGPLHL